MVHLVFVYTCISCLQLTQCSVIRLGVVAGPRPVVKNKVPFFRPDPDPYIVVYNIGISLKSICITWLVLISCCVSELHVPFIMHRIGVYCYFIRNYQIVYMFVSSELIISCTGLRDEVFSFAFPRNLSYSDHVRGSYQWQ